jgi:hypothetical protein
MIMQMGVHLPSQQAVLSFSVLWLVGCPVHVIPGRSISPHPCSLHKSYSMDSFTIQSLDFVLGFLA